VCGTESRQFGYEARLRTQRDARSSDSILIPDPSQTALASDVIVAWQVYVKIVSVQHEVYLQVWPSTCRSGARQVRRAANHLVAVQSVTVVSSRRLQMR